MTSKQKARLGLVIFFATLLLGTTYIERKVLLLGGSIDDHMGLIYALGWWVTVSSLVARLVLWESLRDVSFRWGGRAGTRAMIVATAMPLVVGFVANGTAWQDRLRDQPPTPSRAQAPTSHFQRPLDYCTNEDRAKFVRTIYRKSGAWDPQH